MSTSPGPRTTLGLAALALLITAPLLVAQPPTPATAPEKPAMTLSAATIRPFVALALGCVHREYPNKIAHVMEGDADVRPPRELTPVFYGCFDWHSSVHGHWLLARAHRQFPDADFAPTIEAALAKSITPAGIAAEVAYLEGAGRSSFERPYGLAWLLQLAAELHQSPPTSPLHAHAATLEPLERLCARRFQEWLPKLSHPIRTGEHSQTAFGLGLALDWARIRGDQALAQAITTKVLKWHGAERGQTLRFEPSGQDFLSPVLAVADLMRRVLEPAAFAAWLGAYLPEIPLQVGAEWLPIAVVTDPTDGKLAHLDGLNLSRAWMLDGLLSGLPEGDPRRAALAEARDAHRGSGVASVTGAHYEGGHWLGSFALYLVTQRGLR